jgi:hypothetical protein
MRGKVKAGEELLDSRGPIRYYVCTTPMANRRLIHARFFSAFALLVLIAAPSSAQFEGVVETANVSSDEYGRAVTFTMTMWVAPTGVRIGIPATGSAPGVTIIGRTDRAVRWVLNDADKTYFELPIEAPPDDGAPTEEPAGFKRTGKKKKILGYNAEQLVLKNGSVTTEIWATGDLRPLVETLDRALGGGEVEGGGPWNSELSRQGLFPLRALTKDGKDVLESSDVTKISRVRVNPALLELPPEYRRQGVRDVIRDETIPEP